MGLSAGDVSTGELVQGVERCSFSEIKIKIPSLLAQTAGVILSLTAI